VAGPAEECIALRLSGHETANPIQLLSTLDTQGLHRGFVRLDRKNLTEISSSIKITLILKLENQI